MFEMNFIGTHSVFSKDDRQKLVFKHNYYIKCYWYVTRYKYL